MKKLILLCIATLTATFMWVPGNAQTYCTPSVGTSSVEPITSVVYAGIDNTTDASIDGTPGLEDFTSMTANVDAGGTKIITLQGNTSGNYSTYFTVFIDWNQNGTLDDAGEVYQIGS